MVRLLNETAFRKSAKPCCACTKKNMKVRIVYVVLITMVPLMAFGRLIQIISPKELIANSKLVFVGKVRSVEASGIATPLSYPTLEGVLFPWLKVKMEVLAPLKGVHKG